MIAAQAVLVASHQSPERACMPFRIVVSYFGPESTYVASFFNNGLTEHFPSRRGPEDALEEARFWLQTFVGDIVQSSQVHFRPATRLARWEGVSFLLLGDQAVQISEEEIRELHGQASREIEAFLQRLSRDVGRRDRFMIADWLNQPLSPDVSMLASDARHLLYRQGNFDPLRS